MYQYLLRFVKRFQRGLIWLWAQEGTPSQRARGIAIGVFCGCFPFFGFQTLLGIWLAKIFRANLVFAAIGTWISNPFTYLPLYWFNYYIGSILIGHEKSLKNLQHISYNDIWAQGLLFTIRLSLGSIVVGLFSGFLTLLIFQAFLMKSFRIGKFYWMLKK